ncbi:MAG: hypothetical protein ACK44A_02765 [Roseateles sp.]
MTLHPDTVKELQDEFPKLCERLQRLQVRVVAEGQRLPADSLLREHMLYGVGRRLSVIRRSAENIFTLFPPDSIRPLDLDTLADVQVNLHAFVMNVYGIFDNWGWVFVLRHGLDSVIVNKKGDVDRGGVGLFAKATQRHLPDALKDYITSHTIEDWHKEYAKSFRDALAHRIPPYIAPAILSPEEGARFNELETEQFQCIASHDWGRLEAIRAEQSRLGRPCFSFVHSHAEGSPSRHVYLHPQLICDGLLLVEFGELFLQYWGDVAAP